MGGRQSTQSTGARQNVAVSGRNPVRHSLDGSLDQSTSSARRIGGLFGQSSSSGLSATPPERGVMRRRRRRDRNDLLIETHSLPSHLFSTFLADIKCPVCNKRVASDDIESHLLDCLAKPRVSYNEDVLKADAGECIICFEDMCQGEQIARLPCLCIYHKKCLDDWFQRNRCCPEHPEQIPQEFTETVSGNSSNSLQENNVNSESITIDESSDLTPESNMTNPVANISLNTGNMSHDHVADSEMEHENEHMLFGDTDVSLDLSPNNDLASPVASPTDELHDTDDNNDEPVCDTDDDADSDAVTCNIHRSPTGKTIVHVDDGSMHGSPGLFDDDEIEQLTSKIKTILVAETAGNSEVDNT